MSCIDPWGPPELPCLTSWQPSDWLLLKAGMMTPHTWVSRLSCVPLLAVAAPVARLTHADWPPEVRHTRGTSGLITWRAIVTRSPGVVTHRDRVQSPPLEADHGLAIEDEPLDGAVQPNDDPGLGGDAVEVPGTGRIRRREKLASK